MMNENAALPLGPLANSLLDLDDTFRFHCKMCGKCCVDRDDIILSPKDLYRIALALGKPPIEVFTKHCEAYFGNTSGMVIVRLRPVGAEKRCPLLSGARCSVHQSKPTVCALFPLGRALVTPASGVSKASPQYFLQKVSCGDLSEVHTVRAWLDSFGVSVDDPFFPLWSHTVMDYGRIVKILQEKVGAETNQLLFAAILGGIYLNYDTGKPFPQQFQRNDFAFRKMMQSAGVSSGLSSIPFEGAGQVPSG